MNFGAAALAFLLISVPAFSFAGSMPEEVEECLDCHEDDSLEKEMGDGETLSLFVEGAGFAASVHSGLGCTGCHPAVNLDDHPGERDIAGRSEYILEASKACGRCHSGKRLDEEPMHRYLNADAGGPPCAECHRAHELEPIETWKAEVDDRTYCLACHGKKLHLHLENGEELALRMEENILDSSVHSDHDCTDCHGDFGKDTHFVRDFKNRREHSIALAETCRECHDEMYEAFENSIHYSMLDRGNLAAPVCTDCHGFHSVGPKAALETIAGEPCRRCHQEVFEVYSTSMHGVARQEPDQGHLDAPICADCHQAHGILAADWAERLREACLGCHEEIGGKHEQWLPNAGLHLDVVACPACHAPGADRGIDLQIYDGNSHEPMSDEGLRTLLEGDMLRDAAVDGLNSIELWEMLRGSGGEEGSPLVLQGRLKVRTGIEAHRMSFKGDALGDCDVCHREGAEPFESVTVSLLRVDGRPLRYEADGDVLTSAASVGSVGNFYALGSTRIRILDFLLIAAVLGGMSVPALHMTARVLAGRK